MYGRYTTRAMGAMQDVARVAGALGEPSRLAILAALLEGEATVSDLATRLGLAQPRVSTHLARLRGAGLVTRVAMGRHRAYRADAARVKPLLDALYATGPAAVSRPSRQAGRERRGRPGAPGKPAYELSASGTRALARRGVDVGAARESRRRFATACLDWTERRPHLGGALGARILDALRGEAYVRRRGKGRDVQIVKPLAGWLAG